MVTHHLAPGLHSSLKVPAMLWRAGFRYVAVRGLPSGFTFTKDMLTAHFVHSDLPRVASLTLPKVAATTSTATPDILNEIYHSTLCAQMSQLWSIPTDCPQVSPNPSRHVSVA